MFPSASRTRPSGPDLPAPAPAPSRATARRLPRRRPGRRRALARLHRCGDGRRCTLRASVRSERVLVAAQPDGRKGRPWLTKNPFALRKPC
jgi:hypothetical protein